MREYTFYEFQRPLVLNEIKKIKEKFKDVEFNFKVKDSYILKDKLVFDVEIPTDCSSYQYIASVRTIKSSDSFELLYKEFSGTEEDQKFIDSLTDLKCSKCNKPLTRGYIFKKDKQYIVLGSKCLKDLCIPLSLIKGYEQFNKLNLNLKEKSKSRHIDKAYKTEVVLQIIDEVTREEGFTPKSFKNSTLSKVQNYLENTDIEITSLTKEKLEELRKAHLIERSDITEIFSHNYIEERDLPLACCYGIPRVQNKIKELLHPELVYNPYKDSVKLGTEGERLTFKLDDITFKYSFNTQNAYQRYPSVINVYEIKSNNNILKMYTSSAKDFSSFKNKECTCIVKKHEEHNSGYITIIKNLRILKD